MVSNSDSPEDTPGSAAEDPRRRDSKSVRKVGCTEASLRMKPPPPVPTQKETAWPCVNTLEEDMVESSFRDLFSTARSEDDFLEEQRAILRYIEENNENKKRAALPNQETKTSDLCTTPALPSRSAGTAPRKCEEVEGRAGLFPAHFEDVVDDSDDAVIQEQLRILHEIRGVSRLPVASATRADIDNMIEIRAPAATHNVPPPASSSNPNPRTTLDEHERRLHTPQDTSPHTAAGTPSARGSENFSPSQKLSSAYQDRTLTFRHGGAVRVRGTRRVYQSMAAGTAVLARCASCGTVSYVPAGCQALYCTRCHQVSPVVTTSDAELAQSVQRQEKEATSCPQNLTRTTSA